MSKLKAIIKNTWVSRENLTNKEKKDLAYSAYKMTMNDLAYDSGEGSMENAKILLADLEEKEMYEECLGVLRAMETYGFIRNFYIVTEQNDLSDKIKLNYDNTTDNE